MIAFWIICILMLGVTLVILLPPFVRKESIEDTDRNKSNIKIARQRLAELQADTDSGHIQPSEFSALRAELERTLLMDLESGVTQSKNHSHPLWSALVAIVLPLAVGGLYLIVGAPNAMLAPEISIAKSQVESTSTASLADQEAQIHDEEEEIKSQLLIAQEYMAMQHYSEAAQTLEDLRNRVGDHPVILVRNANALAMADNGKLEGRALALVNFALAMDPIQPQGLWLAGMAAFQRDDNGLALKYWKRLEPLIPLEDPDALAGIKKIIAQAEDRLSQDGSDGAIVSPVNNEASLLVRVTLDESLLDQVALDDRLFVFVQSLQGPPIPLAVVSKRVEDLPLTVLLNDAMAMLPEMKLSNFESVRVGARISKSGDAIPQSGDFQGEISPVKLSETSVVDVIISKIIP